MGVQNTYICIVAVIVMSSCNYLALDLIASLTYDSWKTRGIYVCNPFDLVLICELIKAITLFIGVVLEYVFIQVEVEAYQGLVFRLAALLYLDS